ncbi:MAG: germination protein YpeB [Xylanivirga thermophila]|jgi:spore germination protein|uniref:germination protein YpeB n=1 Tax=Xylanivirga thermophila TaxID=2496273 RepID=UPI00101B71D7|nr:germination protein YpeB [Xylanivirga thermophila]
MARRVWIIVLVAALIGVGIWGYNNYVQNMQYSTYMDNIYQKSFYELVGHVSNIESALSKLMISGDQSQHMIILSDVLRQADAAQKNLGELPLSHVSLDKTAKMLNQMADYSYYLVKKVGGGKTLSTEEYDNLQVLHNNYAKLTDDLRLMQNDVNNNGVKWGEITRVGNKKVKNAGQDLITQQFTKIEHTTIDYPRLIYDGPFSEAVQEGKIKLEGKDINEKQAQDIASRFIGKDRTKFINVGNDTKGNIDCWNIYIDTKDSDKPLLVSISKKGGEVVEVAGDLPEQETKISMEKAVDMATNFLKEKGYDNMVPTYKQHYQGQCTINFAYKQGDTIVYPDLIKIKISLKDGKVFGFEAKNYIANHKERKIGEPKLTEKEARELVNSRFNITSERLAIIPTISKGERLCYEFKGKYGDDNFIIYIDANTGEEADILKIIDTNSGQLVI